MGWGYIPLLALFVVLSLSQSKGWILPPTSEFRSFSNTRSVVVVRSLTHSLVDETMANDNDDNRDDEIQPVILVVGACALDRLLNVPTYPSADAKVRTSTYHEMGGGNAANTATAMARLADTGTATTTRGYRIKLCSKIGDDYIGKQVMHELESEGVDLSSSSSSSLFLVESPGTTAFATIVVSSSEATRTCIYTPGSCGELTMQDFRAADMDQVFGSVVHLHSDGRHTEVALALAREARDRGIPVSLDVERDRKSKSLDALLEVATTVFTNEHQMADYLERLDRERGVDIEQPTSIEGSGMQKADLRFFAQILKPSAFFTRWFRQVGKEVVITLGAQGAVSVKCESIDFENTSEENKIQLTAGEGWNAMLIEHRTRHCFSRYQVHTVGVLSDLKVIDTTGAGDAFIGAFVLAQLFGYDVSTSLAFGSWVGGRKVEGPGARQALPSSSQVASELGGDHETIAQSLKLVVGKCCRIRESVSK